MDTHAPTSHAVLNPVPWLTPLCRTAELSARSHNPSLCGLDSQQLYCVCVCVFAREVESSEYSIAFVAGCLETDQIGWSAVGMQRLTGFTINRALKSHG